MRKYQAGSFLPSPILALLLSITQAASAIDYYGVDVSYPMHYKHFTNLPQEEDLFGTKQQELYQDHMEGCFEAYNEAQCLHVDDDRIGMNLRQPQSMVNYTQKGYVKLFAPDVVPQVWQLVQDFWNTNRHSTVPEEWSPGSIYVNHWAAKVEMVAVDNTTLPGGGNILKTAIWQAARSTLSEWTGHHLADCSMWGIRIYHEGAILAPHVDRLPLVASAILNVDQDVDEPWPLEVIGHNGRATNVTMKPGDLVLYESHSIIHGRPFPLKGRFMANIFIHFEPVAPLSEPNPVVSRGELPPYVMPNSPEVPHWQMQHPDGWHAVQTQQLTGGTTEAHQIVIKQDLDDLKYILDLHPYYANAADELGWTPLHEATRTMRLDLVKTLVEYGADINAKTKGGESVLFLALYFVELSDTPFAKQPYQHPMVQYLQGLGARLEKDGWDPQTGQMIREEPSQEL